MNSFHTLSYHFINYINLNEADIKAILEIRNQDAIKIWMVNTQPIGLQQHLDFIKNLQQDSTKKYFAIKDKENNLIGSVNVHFLENNIVERGIFINPLFQKKGHAEKSILEFYSYLSQMGITKVFTRVKENNVSSNSLEKKLGATLVESKEGYNFYILNLK